MRTRYKTYADYGMRKSDEEKTRERLKERCVGIDMTWESWRSK